MMDINCDMGEGMDNEEDLYLYPFCNILPAVFMPVVSTLFEQRLKCAYNIR